MPYRLSDPWSWKLPKGVRYSGDRSPVPHGGMWYSMKNWDGDWADAVRVETLDDGVPFGCAHVLLTSGSIHKRDLAGAAKSCGWEASDCTQEMEIEACAGYAGVEPSTEYGFLLLEGGEDRAKAAKYAARHGLEMVVSEAPIYRVIRNWVRNLD